MENCSVEDCGRIRQSGVSPHCATHARHMRLYGEIRQVNFSPGQIGGPYPQCSVSFCEYDANSRQPGAYCDGHYQAHYRGRDPEKTILGAGRRTRHKCLIEGCISRAQRSGHCTLHHLKIRTGVLAQQEGEPIKLTSPCAFDGCDSRAVAYKDGSLCATHGHQQRRGISLRPAEEWGKYIRGEVQCAIPGCHKPATGKEVCVTHASKCTQYRLTVEQLIRLLSIQECQIDGCTETKRLVIDHDHATGLVRGRLCTGCNTAIGHAKERPERLSGMISYLASKGSGVLSDF